MTSKATAEYKIIADHLRSSCFLIADGILPSNEGRGYVLRRIMRRAMLQIFKLGAKKAIMYKLVDVLIKEMSAAYPQLIEAKDLTVETLKNEEEKFRSTLKNGLKIIENEIAHLKESTKKTFDGKIAFKLHDTYGFPLDLTQIVIAENYKNQNIKIDIKAFDEEMALQKQRAKANWKGGGEESLDENILKLQSELGETYFSGYDENQSQTEILYISNNNEEVQEISQNNELENCYIILDQTPFYATSGGQRGDNGYIINQNNKAKIKEARKIGTLFIHQVETVTGKLQKNATVTAKIDDNTRQKRTCNHSATHLMHQALKDMFGNAVTQKGSNVDSKGFTFDFNLNRAMSADEIEKVEDIVNSYIQQSCPTQVKIMDLEEAKKSGAAALFGEKYEQKVRVVSMGEENNKDKPFSVELCGGTHVNNSSEIQFFKIISEKSIASGIRRIEAKTHAEAKNYVINKLLIKTMVELDIQRGVTKERQEEILKINPKEKLQEINATESDENLKNIANFDSEKITKEIRLIKKEIEEHKQVQKIIEQKIKQHEKNQLVKKLDNIKIENINGINIISHSFKDISSKDLNQINATLRVKYNESAIIILFASSAEKINALIQISQNLLEKFNASDLIKLIAKDIGAKGGGGKKDFAMSGGKNPYGANAAIATIKNQIS